MILAYLLVSKYHGQVAGAAGACANDADDDDDADNDTGDVDRGRGVFRGGPRGPRPPQSKFFGSV